MHTSNGAKFPKQTQLTVDFVLLESCRCLTLGSRFDLTCKAKNYARKMGGCLLRARDRSDLSATNAVANSRNSAG